MRGLDSDLAGGQGAGCGRHSLQEFCTHGALAQGTGHPPRAQIWRGMIPLSGSLGVPLEGAVRGREGSFMPHGLRGSPFLWKRPRTGKYMEPGRVGKTICS